MTLRQKPARNVDRDAAAKLRLAAVDHAPGFAVLAEAEILVMHEFGSRKAIMQLDEIEIVRAESRHFISRLRRKPRHRIEVHHRDVARGVRIARKRNIAMMDFN